MRDFGVIFDMDGVLIDSNEAHFRVFQLMGEKLGTPYPRELWARSIGMHNNEIFPLWLGADLSHERVRELADEKEALYRDRAAAIIKPVRDAVELVRGLHASGVRLAVGSSGPRLNVALALGVLGVGELFSAVVTGDDVARGKPDPAIFLAAATRLGLAPTECIVIEDAPQGIQAALAAGMRVVGLRSEVQADLSSATIVIDSLAELDVSRLRKLVG